MIGKLRVEMDPNRTLIPVYSPYLPKGALRKAQDALKSGWLSSTGEYIERATTHLQELLRVKHVLLVNNGTAAMHLVSKAVHLKKPDVTHIIVPSCAYVAAWNPWLYDGHFRLLPMDVELTTWNMDKHILRYVLESEFCDKPVAVCAVHNLGAVMNVSRMQRCFQETIFVEDSCEGLFGTYDRHFSGTASLCSAISFYGNKNITSGEGGAVIVNDDEVYEHLKKVHAQGQTKERFVHDVLGYNYRMTNIEAAILCDQLERLDEIRIKKNLVFGTYREVLSGIEGVSLQEDIDGTKSANWMLGVRVIGSEGYKAAREFFYARGIDTRPMFYPMSEHEHLKEYSAERYEYNARLLSKEVVVVPSYPELTSEEIERICTAVKEYAEMCAPERD